jgi:ferredoxin
MPKVNFVKEKKTIEVADGANLRKEARKSGVELYPRLHRTMNCHGWGQCGSCRVHVKKGCDNVSKQGFFEKLHLILFPIFPLSLFGRIGHEEELRLACRTRVYGDIDVETQPELNWHGEKFWG